MERHTGETILSTGIDIGTTTTQLIFSRLSLQNSSSFGKAPRYEITKKEIIYRSPVHLTPLIDLERIDGEGIKRIIQTEYYKAGFSPEDIDSGAVIITGESVKKRNAESVTESLSQWAGDFVVASAGPDLESLLAGKGSGAQELSRITGKTVINIDIGGGTSNLCLFKNGQSQDTACLDIGGRAIQIKENHISAITSKIQDLVKSEKMPLSVGDSLTEQKTRDSLQKIVSRLVEILEAAVFLRKQDPFIEKIKTHKLLNPDSPPDIVTLSGGVADCYHTPQKKDFPYDDIGVLLARALRSSRLSEYIKTAPQPETLNATVIGAGSYSMELSGSTVSYRNCTFPMKNIPIIPITLFSKGEVIQEKLLSEKISAFRKEYPKGLFALSAEGKRNPSFPEIEKLAEVMSKIWSNLHKSPLILLIKEDMAKALGQALFRRVPPELPIICLDNVECRSGDYIDIGKPVASGTVLPVVIKTLIFEGEYFYDS